MAFEFIKKMMNRSSKPVVPERTEPVENTEESRRRAELKKRLDDYIDSHIVVQKAPEKKFARSAAKSSGMPDMMGGAAFSIPRPAPQACEQSMDMPCPMLESAMDSFSEEHESALSERMKHLSDTWQQYLLYLIKSKGMSNAEVYKRALVDKKVFSKIKANADYHPKKMTALCLCVGAKLNLDETGDLLARAGYALSPCDKTDLIFSFFIENGIYDMIEIDIQLEEYGLPCIIA